MVGRPVLVVGAGGFIGQAALTELRGRGHPVTALVRRPDGLERRHPGTSVRTADLAHLATSAAWTEHVAGHDAILYAAGLLRARDGGDPERLHGTVPLALADAAEQAGVRRLIHLSILGVEAPTRFARSRIAADTALATRAAPATLVVRPSLLIGRGASGGTALLRALAALPWRTPLVDGGRQHFQPLALDHFAAFLADAVAQDAPTGLVEAVGPDTLELRDILALYRAWLGLPPVPGLTAPSALLRPVARLGDVIRLDPITTEALEQLRHGSAGAPTTPYAKLAAVPPPRLADWLAAHPATPQDRIDAATWLLRPALRVGLAVFWLASAAVGLLGPSPAEPVSAVERIGPALPQSLPGAIWAAGALVALLLGAALLLARDQRLVGQAQLVAILLWTALFGIVAPQPWHDVLASLLKSLPLLLAATIHLAWSNRR